MIMSRRSNHPTAARVLVALWLSLSAAAPALAAPITYELTATVYQAAGDVPASIAPGTTLTATVSWDPSTAIETDPPGADGRARYEWLPAASGASIALEIAGFSAVSDGAQTAFVNIVSPTFGSGSCCDLLQFGVSSIGTGLGITNLELLLKDGDANALSSLALPTSLDLSDWDDPGFNFVILDGGVGAVLSEIDTLTLIPEPSTGLLVGLGLAALARHGRRRT